MINKFFSVISYLLATASLIILIKTEARKWFVFNGESNPSNMVIFWVSLIASMFFFYVGYKLWIKNE